MTLKIKLAFEFFSDAFDDVDEVDHLAMYYGLEEFMESLDYDLFRSDRVREKLSAVYCAMADFAEVAKEEGL